MTADTTNTPPGYAAAPKELWLQLHGDCSDAELSEPVDYENDDVTWCWHAIHNSDVRYVRADLALPAPEAIDAQGVEEGLRAACRELLEAFDLPNGPDRGVCLQLATASIRAHLASHPAARAIERAASGAPVAPPSPDTAIHSKQKR